MKKRRPPSGASLTEMLMVGALILLGLFFGRIFMGNFSFFGHTQTRATTVLGARACMDAIAQSMRNGKARSLVIATPSGPPLVPNSRVDFTLQAPLMSGATAYAIYLANGIVYAQEFAPPNGARGPRALASNVSMLMFTGNAKDPALVNVTLQITAPYEKNSSDASRVTVLAPVTATVRMSELP